MDAIDGMFGKKNPELLESCSVDVDKLLEGLEHIEVAEKLSRVEMLTTFEMPNTYRVLKRRQVDFLRLRDQQLPHASA